MEKSAKIIVIFWFLIIALFTISQEIILQKGREVLLKTVPVDPRDITRGEYVNLSYEISRLPSYKENFHYNDTVYAKLDVDSKNIASVSKFEQTKPQLGNLFIKGKVTRCNGFSTSTKDKCIKFGIESYFVKEGEARKLEYALQNKDWGYARVVIDKNGNAVLIGVEGR